MPTATCALDVMGMLATTLDIASSNSQLRNENLSMELLRQIVLSAPLASFRVRGQKSAISNLNPNTGPETSKCYHLGPWHSYTAFPLVWLKKVSLNSTRKHEIGCTSIGISAGIGASRYGESRQ